MNNQLFARISYFVDKESFTLKCWDDRYSKGVWACCLPHDYYCEEVSRAAGSGDLNMMPATDYLLACKWLPIVVGETLVEALKKLEARLNELDDSQLKEKSDWMIATFAAMNHLEKVREASNDYGGTEGKYMCLPEDFRHVARAVERQQEKGGKLKW